MQPELERDLAILAAVLTLSAALIAAGVRILRKTATDPRRDEWR